ncbi:MAG: hypothetical protein ACI8ZN_001871 [Bacteroidia bacterium]|jgi:hypothetical protein
MSKFEQIPKKKPLEVYLCSKLYTQNKMKRLKISLMVAFMAVGAFVMNGCDGTGTDPIEAAKPVLNFLAGAGYTSQDGNIPVGTDFKIGLSASHESKIKSLQITVSYDGGAQVTPVGCTMCDSTLDSKTLTTDFSWKVEAKVGSEKWFFTVADKDGNETTKTITLNRTAAPKPVQRIDVTLGNQKATQGSSLDLNTMSVYSLSAANTNSASVDIVYVVDDIDGSIFCAPSNATAAAKLGGANGVANWATRNASKIRKTSISQTQFENATDSKDLLAEIASSAATTDKVVSLTPGAVYYVEPVSVSGRFALIAIGSIDVDNTMTIRVLVEK